MSSSDLEGPPPGATPLMLACQSGDHAQVQHWVRNKPDSVTQKDAMGRTALHYCAESENAHCAVLLLDAVQDLLNERDTDGYSVLHLAVQTNNLPLFQLLLQRGANVNAVDNEKHTPVHWAAVCGNIEMLDHLMSSKANPSTPDSHTAYPIHYAAQMCGSDEAVGMQILNKLLAKGVPVDCVDQDDRQPLLWAASGGSCKACQVLVKSGAKVECFDKDGLTALHCASSRGHADTIFTLVTECKAKVDSVDKNGCTSLFYALTMLHLHCANILIELGTNTNHQDRKGRSPAHCSAGKGSIPGLEILDNHHGNLWLSNNKGDCPIHEAAQGRHVDTVLYLLKLREGTMDLANNEGRTCLHIAATNNDVQMCETLIEHGADVNKVMKHKDKLLSPLDAALTKGNSECSTYLRTRGAATGDKIINCAARTIQKSWKNNREKIKKKKSAPPPGKMESLPPEKDFSKKSNSSSSSPPVSKEKGDDGNKNKMEKKVEKNQQNRMSHQKSSKMSPRSGNEVKPPKTIGDNTSPRDNNKNRHGKENVPYKVPQGVKNQSNDMYSQHARTTARPKSTGAPSTAPKSTNANTTSPQSMGASSAVPRSTAAGITTAPKSAPKDTSPRQNKSHTAPQRDHHGQKTESKYYQPKSNIGEEVWKSVKIYEFKRQASHNLVKFKRLQMMKGSGPSQDEGTVVNKLMKLQESDDKEIEGANIADWDTYLKDQLKALSVTSKNKMIRNLSATLEKQFEQEAIKAKKKTDEDIKRQGNHQQQIEAQDNMDKQIAESALSDALEKTSGMYEKVNSRANSALERARESNAHLQESVKKRRDERLARSGRKKSGSDNDSPRDHLTSVTKETDRETRVAQPNGNADARDSENETQEVVESEEKRRNSYFRENKSNKDTEFIYRDQEGTRKSRKAIMEERRRVHEEWRNTQLTRRERSLFSAYAPLIIPKDDPGKQEGKKKQRTKSAPPRSSLNFDNMANKHDLDQMDHSLPSVSEYPARPSTSVGYHRSRTPSNTHEHEDLQTEMIMTPNGIVKKKLNLNGKDPSIESRTSTPIQGNYSPRYDGSLRPRSSLVFMDPDTYEEKKKQEHRSRNKQGNSVPESTETHEHTPAEVAIES